MNPLSIDCPQCEAEAGQPCIEFVNVMVGQHRGEPIFERRSYEASPHLTRKDAIRAQTQKDHEPGYAG